jgi:hypothetical protein
MKGNERRGARDYELPVCEEEDEFFKSPFNAC